MPEPKRKIRPTAPGGGGDDSAPNAPNVDKPNVNDLLKRMKKVDPDTAKRYRQRTGE